MEPGAADDKCACGSRRATAGAVDVAGGAGRLEPSAVAIPAWSIDGDRHAGEAGSSPAATRVSIVFAAARGGGDPGSR